MYISSLLLRKDRNGCKCVCVCERESESERERERVRQTKDCYHWHQIFLTHVMILYLEPHFDGGWSGLFLNVRPLPPLKAASVCYECTLLLTDRLSCGCWNCVPTANLSLWYNIFNALTFPSGSQFTWFISAVSLSILRHRFNILCRNPQLTCYQYVTLWDSRWNLSRIYIGTISLHNQLVILFKGREDI